MNIESVHVEPGLPKVIIMSEYREWSSRARPPPGNYMSEMSEY